MTEDLAINFKDVRKKYKNIKEMGRRYEDLYGKECLTWKFDKYKISLCSNPQSKRQILCVSYYHPKGEDRDIGICDHVFTNFVNAHETCKVVIKLIKELEEDKREIPGKLSKGTREV